MFPISKSWYEALSDVLNAPEFQKLQQFLAHEYANKQIYPTPKNVFSAINFMKPNQVKVVIVGQDPYHQPGQAHGLAFSVQEGVPVPPSLQNIFKEINQEFGTPISQSGNLERWAKQGVLLLNSVLTVERSKPNAHKGMGWEAVTKQIISVVNKLDHPVVFLLWGNNAKQLASAIDTHKHFVYTAVHPSPMSANRGGWFGNGCFKKTNETLLKLGQKPINW